MAKKKKSKKAPQIIVGLFIFFILLSAGVKVTRDHASIKNNEATFDYLSDSKKYKIDNNNDEKPINKDSQSTSTSGFDQSSRIFVSPTYEGIKNYTVKISKEWIVDYKNGDWGYFLSLENKNGYVISISYVDGEGASCKFGANEVSNIGGPAVKEYGQINTNFGSYRLGEYSVKLEEEIEYRLLFCSKSKYNNTEWIYATDIGNIQISKRNAPLDEKEIAKALSLIKEISIVE